MPLYGFEGLSPQVHARAFIAPTATLVGDVIVEDGASVWYGAVIRADYAPVVVRAGANVQDGAVLHGPPGLTTEVVPARSSPRARWWPQAWSSRRACSRPVLPR